MQNRKWWKEATAYEIYLRSFKDSNGDGVGDLPGIIEKLDYLKYLGVDVLWLCPMYKSPQDDNGYDVSDYQAIHHEFGTMEDFDRLLAETHKRGMRLIIDLVINHTSDEHEWFIESRASKNNPKRDWYIWRDGKSIAPGKPVTAGEPAMEPNNWESIFGGSAWKLDEKTGQYYMHLFSQKQPDLNWENLQMRQTVYAMIRWWLDRGIDGFRVDAISHAKKEPGLADMPNPDGLRYVPSYAKHMNVPGIEEYIEDLCKNTFSRYDVMTVGEANGVTAEEGENWVDEGERKLNMLFQFEHLDLWNNDPENRIDLPKVKSVFSRWQKGMEKKGWNALYLENHDIPRILSKWGDPENFWRQSATSLATLYFLMQGTPFIYQGQEIGMTNTVFRGPEDFDDVRARNTFAENRARGIPDGVTTKELAAGSRDNARTPMQWNAGPHAGFSRGQPWLRVNPNYETINVESQLGKPDSILEYYRRLIQLRKSGPLFVYGQYDLVLAEHPQLYAYTRTLAGEKALVACNVSGRAATYECPPAGVLLLGNYARGAEPGHLRPYEAVVYRLKETEK